MKNIVYFVRGEQITGFLIDEGFYPCRKVDKITLGSYKQIIETSQWLDLLAKITNVTLGQRKDIFRWNLNTNGTFSVRSMYLHMNQDIPFYIWKLKNSPQD
jgi:hypothetical protein